MDAPLSIQPFPLSLHKTLYVFEKDIGSVIITDFAAVDAPPQQIVIELLKSNTNKRNTVFFCLFVEVQIKNLFEFFQKQHKYLFLMKQNIQLHNIY